MHFGRCLWRWRYGAIAALSGLVGVSSQAMGQMSQKQECIDVNGSLQERFVHCSKWLDTGLEGRELSRALVTRAMVADVGSIGGPEFALNSAASDLLAALDVGIDRRPIMLELAALYARHQRFDDALGTIERALTEFPDDTQFFCWEAKFITKDFSKKRIPIQIVSKI